jgi:2-hydroxymuconate-semialdehyde hydrolase
MPQTIKNATRVLYSEEESMSETMDTRVETGPYETHLNRSGEGNEEVILFLHGSGPGATAWSNWQFALPALGERFDCMAPDLIGYGKSQHFDDPPQGVAAWLDVWLDQQVGLLDNLGRDKVHVVGNSMGGALALHLLERYPERVERVVLMGTMGAPHQIRPWLDELWGFYDDPSQDKMAEAIAHFVFDPDAIGGDLDSIAEMRYPAAMDEDVQRSFSAMFPSPRQQHVDDLVIPDLRLQRMQRPVLLVHGRDDGIIPLETSLYLLERLPNVQMHVFGQCRHWIMIEHADAFNVVVEDFLKGDQ